MKTATIRSRVLVGLEARDVTVTARKAQGDVYGPLINGLSSEAATRETQIRVAASLAKLGILNPGVVVTVDPPAPPGSSHLDLPIAVAVIAAGSDLPDELSDAEDSVYLGELGLDGRVRPTRGVLPMIDGLNTDVVVSVDNGKEAALSGARVFDVEHLGVAAYDLNQINPRHSTDFEPSPPPDAWGDLRTTPAVRRALEVAAAGGHSVLLVGPPGSGKTLIARALWSILPPLSRDEAVEVTKIHSVAGLLDGDVGYVATRPFCAPHHSVSEAGLVGGGAFPRPGEVSLAHRGVLFLDELAEFRAGALEALRGVLREGCVKLSTTNLVGAMSRGDHLGSMRAAGEHVRGLRTVDFPARPMLVASVNPCPCGYKGHPSRECRCTPERVKAYWDRLEPWLGMFDVRIDVPALTAAELTTPVGVVEDPRPRIAAAWRERG